jgi:hypothetical protein
LTKSLISFALNILNSIFPLSFRINVANSTEYNLRHFRIEETEELKRKKENVHFSLFNVVESIVIANTRNANFNASFNEHSSWIENYPNHSFIIQHNTLLISHRLWKTNKPKFVLKLK